MTRSAQRSEREMPGHVFGAVPGPTKEPAFAGRHELRRLGLAALAGQGVARRTSREIDVVDGRTVDHRLNTEMQLTQNLASKT